MSGETFAVSGEFVAASIDDAFDKLASHFASVRDHGAPVLDPPYQFSVRPVPSGNGVAGEMPSNPEQGLQASDYTMELPPVRYSLVVDFDGVIHQYVSGWQGSAVIADPPVDGAIAWLEAMLEHYDIVIATTRANEPEGVAAIIEWLAANGFDPNDGRVSIVGKPAGLLYVDDRGFRFRGKFPTLNQVRHALRPWKSGDGIGPSWRTREAKRKHEWQLMQAKLSRLKRERVELYTALVEEILVGAGYDAAGVSEWLERNGKSWEERVAMARQLRDEELDDDGSIRVRPQR